MSNPNLRILSDRIIRKFETDDRDMVDVQVSREQIAVVDMGEVQEVFYEVWGDIT